MVGDGTMVGTVAGVTWPPLPDGTSVGLMVGTVVSVSVGDADGLSSLGTTVGAGLGGVVL